jgi:hypothetical protein
MSTFFSAIGNISRACLGQGGRLAFCLLDRNLVARGVEHGLVHVWDNARLSQPIAVNWGVAALCRPGWPDIDFVVVGKQGQLLLIGPDNTSRELTPLDGQPSARPALLRDARVVGGCIYAVGAAHRMLRIEPDLPAG